MKHNRMLLGFALLPLCGYTQPKVTQRPNIIFILSDDHARTAISAYGGINAQIAPTPNIDRIASTGAILDNMICTNSISGPSRACLLTGKYSTTNGFYQNEGGVVFDNTQPTFPSILHENGYSTSLFGKWHLFSTPAGFDHYMIHDNVGQQGTYWNPIYNVNGTKVRQEGYCTNLTTDAALEWLASSRDVSKPFCMLLHYKAPHRPWDPDTKYLNLFDDVEMPYPASFDDDYKGRELTLGRNMASIENHLSRRDMKQTPPEGLTGKQLEQWLSWGGAGENQFWTPDSTMTRQEMKKWKFQKYVKDYLRCVRSVDDNVGRVLDYLTANNLLDNTIIIYMGDQGFFLGEHGIYDKRWFYEESIQMPCLISYPSAIKAGSRVEQLSVNVDIAPTILDYASVKMPKDIQGTSMKALLADGAQPKWRDKVYYHYFEYPLWHNVQPHYGVRTQRYKLMHFYYDVDKWEFYDLQSDPGELTNAIDNASYAPIIADLKKEIVKLQKQYNDYMPIEERRQLTKKHMVSY